MCKAPYKQSKYKLKVYWMEFGVAHFDVIPLTWHWWSWGRCSTCGVPRQLRLRTGPLPSVPYFGPQARRWQRQLPASDLSTAASGSTQARWKPDPQASRAANPEPPSQRAEHRSCPLSTAFPSEKHRIRVWLRVRPSFIIRSYASLAAVCNANLMAAWKRDKIRTPRKNTRDKVLYALTVKTHPAVRICAQTFNSSPHRWRDF